MGELMLTKKTYIATSEILSSYKDLIGDEFTYHDLVDDFAAMFAEDNPRFDADKFFNSCMINVM
jgi:hypothetical protein